MNQSTRVTRSRFEIVEDGEISYLEFETDGHGWMTIWHTEVAEAQRGKGLGSRAGDQSISVSQGP